MYQVGFFKIGLMAIVSIGLSIIQFKLSDYKQNCLKKITEQDGLRNYLLSYFGAELLSNAQNQIIDGEVSKEKGAYLWYNMNDYLELIRHMTPEEHGQFSVREHEQYLDYLQFVKPTDQSQLKYIKLLDSANQCTIQYITYVRMLSDSSLTDNLTYIALGIVIQICNYLSCQIVRRIYQRKLKDVKYKTNYFYDSFINLTSEFESYYLSLGRQLQKNTIIYHYQKQQSDSSQKAQERDMISLIQMIFPAMGFGLAIMRELQNFDLPDDDPTKQQKIQIAIQAPIQFYSASRSTFGLIQSMFPEFMIDADQYKKDLEMDEFMGKIKQRMQVEKWRQMPTGKDKKERIYTIKNLSCKILKNIDLTINKGDRIALVGKNGNGKTTLLKVLCKLYNDYNKNQVQYNGIDLKSIHPDQYFSRVQIIQQKQGIFNDSIYNNIIVGLGYCHNAEQIQKDKYYGKVIEFLKKMDLQKLIPMLDKTPSEQRLSGGQRQIIVILRAFLRDFDVLLLDEFTTYLDQSKQKIIFDIIKDLNRTKGITVVCVTHLQDELSYFNRVIEMDNGKIKKEKTKNIK